MIKKSVVSFLEIHHLINGFCEKYLDEEFAKYCLNLLDEVNNETDISRGDKKNWAAGVVYAIARVNFLFDSNSRFPLTVDIICDYFDANKSTASSKASSIVDLCYLEIGDPNFCTDEVVDGFTLVEIDKGFIVPKSFVNRISAVEKRSDGEFENLKRKKQKERLKRNEERIMRLREQELLRAKKRKK